MRRVTFLVHRYWMLQLGWGAKCQRTIYYMPWGVVTVDELCKMEGPTLFYGVGWDNDAPYEMG